MPPILELRNITKTFPGVLANDQVSLSLNQGEILALLGENGAGKSTLMNILYGLYSPNEGEILVRGEPTVIQSPKDAIRQGIGMVHQHFMLVAPLTVTENVMLGNEPVSRWLFLDRKRASAKIREISDLYGLQVDPSATIETLPVGVQQRVEIIKVLYRNADILILDEPTAVLTPQEVEDLFSIVRTLVDSGKSLIFITHKLNEVLSLADRIVVLRRGRLVGETRPSETTGPELASMMVGREVALEVTKAPSRPQEVVLDVQDLCVFDDRDSMAVDHVTMQVRAGEIVGVAGVQGNGQTELINALTGLRPVAAGSVHINGTNTTRATPRQIIEMGVAHVPENRQEDGLVMSFPVADNLVLNTYYMAPYARGLVMQDRDIARVASELVSRYDVRTAGIRVPAANLSGGNQQKVIVAREFNRDVRLLVASQPTRGLDVGSIEYIHGRIVEKRDQGAGVLLVSSELDEIMELSDRIVVMYRGKIIATLDAQSATREQVGLLMAGVSPPDHGSVVESPAQEPAG